VILERFIDTGRKFLPDRLSLIAGFDFLAPPDQRFVSQIQGRTYASLFGLMPKRQALFRPLEAMMAACMPAGYAVVPDPGALAGLVRSRAAWSVLAAGCLVELLAQSHFRQGAGPGAHTDPLWAEVLRLHCEQATERAKLVELAWRREDARLEEAARDRAVGDLIVLLGALDGVLQGQARTDAVYFAAASRRAVDAGERARVGAGLLNAYRWQFILSGVQVPHFSALLTGMLGTEQHGRIAAALAPLFDRSSLPGVRGP
jgi:hypothetical protein